MVKRQGLVECLVFFLELARARENYWSKHAPPGRAAHRTPCADPVSRQMSSRGVFRKVAISRGDERNSIDRPRNLVCVHFPVRLTTGSKKNGFRLGPLLVPAKSDLSARAQKWGPNPQKWAPKKSQKLLFGRDRAQQRPSARGKVCFRKASGRYDWVTHKSEHGWFCFRGDRIFSAIWPVHRFGFFYVAGGLLRGGPRGVWRPSRPKDH